MPFLKTDSECNEARLHTSNPEIVMWSVVTLHDHKLWEKLPFTIYSLVILAICTTWLCAN